MNMLKHVSLLSFLCLIACAPPKASFQIENLQQAKQNEQQPTEKTPLAALPSTQKGVVADQTTIQQPQGKAAVGSKNVPGSWDLSGALAARGKAKAWTASINWLQRGAGTYQIRLNGPLGSGAVLIEKKGGTVSFRDGPKSASSSNAEELLSKHTGIRLPVTSLYYWVRGIPAPGAVQSAQRDASNNLTVLKQGGYTIQYLGYSQVGGASLPSQIKLQGNGVFFKLVIKRWNV